MNELNIIRIIVTKVHTLNTGREKEKRKKENKQSIRYNKQRRGVPNRVTNRYRNRKDIKIEKRKRGKVNKKLRCKSHNDRQIGQIDKRVKQEKLDKGIDRKRVK